MSIGTRPRLQRQHLNLAEWRKDRTPKGIRLGGIEMLGYIESVCGCATAGQRDMVARDTQEPSRHTRIWWLRT